MLHRPWLSLLLLSVSACAGGTADDSGTADDTGVPDDTGADTASDSGDTDSGDSGDTDSGDSGDTDSGDTDSGDTDTDSGDTDSPHPAPDFSLQDVNPTSATAGQAVSPRDYLQKVSGWYFTHAT